MSGSSARNFIPMQNKYDRVVLLVDMDCFYCQVEEKLNPDLKGKPIAVVQYNAWRGGGIIAVNYPARAQGVTRHMRGDEAKNQCPDIQLVKVPNVREKADLTKYREAGKEVANVLQCYTQLLERASVDEAYLDITEAVNKRLEDLNKGLYVLQPDKLLMTYAVGYQNIGEYVTSITNRFANPSIDFSDLNESENDPKIRNAINQSDIRLLVGASVANEIRAEVKIKTGYECSAGIAHNKILAKLACGINKPNKQTILPLTQIPKYFESLPVRKIKGLGAKFGEDVCERLQIKFLGEMVQFTETELQKKFDEKNGSWLYHICRGIDLEAVTPRFYSKSIGCCKKFPGLNNITGLKTLKHWLKELANEIADRLEKDIIENNRKARQMVVSFVQDFNGKEVQSSRSALLTNYDQESLAQQSLDVIRVNTKTFFRPGSEGVLNNPIRFLGISVGKFETISSNRNKLEEMFKNQTAKHKPKEDLVDIVPETELPNEQQTNEIPSSNSKGSLKAYFKSASAVKEPSEIQPNNTELKENGSSKQESPPKAEPEGKTKKKSFLMEYLKKNSTLTASSVVADNSDVMPDESSIAVPKPEEIKRSDSTNKRTSFFLNILQKQKETAVNNKKVDENHENKSLERLSNRTSEKIQLEQLADVNITIEGQRDSIEDVPSSSHQNVDVQNPNKRKHPDDEKPTEDYKSTYAEFAVPALDINIINFTKCETCDAKIPNIPSEIQSHQDHHMALELNRQQSEEFRAQIKSRFNANRSLNQSIQSSKKAKTNNSSKNSKTIKADITQFLKPNITINSQINQTSDASIIDLEATIVEENPDTFLCPECNKFIKNSEQIEHKDYHVAKELQKQLNTIEIRPPTISSSNKTNPNSSKKNVKTLKNQNNIKKPITQYFSKN